MPQQNLTALFTPINIKGLEIKNRIIMAPMQLGLGFRSRRSRAFIVERARGNVGAIILPAMAIDILASDEAWGNSEALLAFLQGLTSLVAEVHNAGAKLGLQLWHGVYFPAGLSGYQGELIAPSPTAEAREFTVPEVEVIVGKFAAAAASAQKAGMDFVEVHGAHGYLPHRFFSPLDNQRKDKYGGSIEKRMTFALECVTSIRQAVGQDYPLFWRLSAEDGVAGGIRLEQSIKLAKALERAGVDVIDVSFGRGFGQGMPLKKEPMGTYVPQAAAIKRKVNVPVIAVGRIHSPQLANDIISQGKADLVAVGRQLIADPQWARKAQEGRFDDIVFCDSCNKNCVSSIPRNGTSSLPADAPLCRLNERAGKEWV